MKKAISLLLTVIMSLSFCSFNAYASSDIKTDFFPSGVLTTPSKPYIFVRNENGSDTVFMFWDKTEDLQNLGNAFMANSETFFNNYKLKDSPVVKVLVDCKIDNGEWHTTQNWKGEVFDSTFPSTYLFSNDLTVYTYGSDKKLNDTIMKTSEYVNGDSANNGFLNGIIKVTGSSKQLDLANHTISFRFMEKLIVNYENGSRKIDFRP